MRYIAAVSASGKHAKCMAGSAIHAMRPACAGPPERQDSSSPMSAIQTLLEILDLEPLEENLFRGRSPQVTWQRVFGGQVIGQALVAAVRTVELRPPHSLHAYFL